MADSERSQESPFYIIEGSQELLTNSMAPTQFLINLTKYVMDEDRRHWKQNRDLSNSKKVESRLGVACIRLSRSASADDVLNLARAIHRSIRPLDQFTRMSERGFWILYQGDEIGCRRAVVRVEENFLQAYQEDRYQKYLRSSLKVRLVMRNDSEAREVWIRRIDDAYFS